MSFIIYKQDASVRKLQPDNQDADKEGFVLHIPNLKVNIQSAGPEYIALTPMGETGKLYHGFTTTLGIRTGMIVETSGTITISGMRLKVIGEQEWKGPMGTHYELTLLAPGE